MNICQRKRHNRRRLERRLQNVARKRRWENGEASERLKAIMAD